MTQIVRDFALVAPSILTLSYYRARRSAPRRLATRLDSTRRLAVGIVDNQAATRHRSTICGGGARLFDLLSRRARRRSTIRVAS